MAIGINFHTAPVGIRERFWIAPAKRREILAYLAEAEGIEEALVLATCKRTEFILWASDATLAANSILRLLSSAYSLQLCEWEHFYRLLGEDALIHVFRVASGLDSMVSGDPEAAVHLEQAWQESRQANCTGRCLDSVLQKAFTVSERLRQDSGIEQPGVSIASVAVETAQEIFESLENRKVALIGAGRLGEYAARFLANHGAMSLRILDRDFERALELAQKVGGTAVPCEDLAEEVANADLVIACAAVAGPLLNEQQVQTIVRQRKSKLLCIIDLGLPRNVAAAIRDLDGVFLYDLDDLEKSIRQSGAGKSAIAAAENIIAGEAKEFQRTLSREHIIPLIVALRERLAELCRIELEAFRRERGPFLREQDHLLTELTSRITQGLAMSLVRHLKEVPEKSEQQHMADAVHRLFHLEAEKELVSSK
jgi:glutamyl-tRNA reductase